MSSTVTVRPTRGVRGIGLFAIIAGIVMILAGIATWIVVSTQLSNEKITVSDDSTFMGGIFAGRPVNGPLTAYAQADIINHHALEATGGQTYAQLPQDDPRRDTVMTASFLRASLFTSVVSFGVCLLVIALGILFIFVGSALRRLAGGPEVTVTGAEAPGLTSDAAAYRRPDAVAGAPGRADAVAGAPGRADADAAYQREAESRGGPEAGAYRGSEAGAYGTPDVPPRGAEITPGEAETAVPEAGAPAEETPPEQEGPYGR